MDIKPLIEKYKEVVTIDIPDLLMTNQHDLEKLIDQRIYTELASRFSKKFYIHKIRDPQNMTSKCTIESYSFTERELVQLCRDLITHAKDELKEALAIRLGRDPA